MVQSKKKHADKPLSLAHLTPEQALFKALTTPMPKKAAKKQKSAAKSSQKIRKSGS